MADHRSIDREKIKPTEKVHPKTLVITALTAATVALISTQITNTVNSVTLVAVASLLTAFISELYRIFLELFSMAVTRNVNRILLKEKIEVDAWGDVRIVENELQNEDADSEAEEDESPAGIPLVDGQGHRDRSTGVRDKIGSAFRSRFATALIFAIIGLATVAGSFGFGALTSDKHYEVTREVVEKRSISQKTLNQIESDAEQTAMEEASRARAEAELTSQELIGLTKSELVSLIAVLEGEIKSLKAEDELNEEEASELRKSLGELTALVDELSTRIDELEEAPTPTPEPPTTPQVTPTPTPQSPEIP